MARVARGVFDCGLYSFLISHHWMQGFPDRLATEVAAVLQTEGVAATVDTGKAASSSSSSSSSSSAASSSLAAVVLKIRAVPPYRPELAVWLGCASRAASNPTWQTASDWADNGAAAEALF